MARASGRGKIPMILMNGQAAAYSSRCRIRGSGTVPPSKIACQTGGCHPEQALLCAVEGSGRAARCVAFLRHNNPRAFGSPPYFAASCAHFASVLKNASPPSAAQSPRSATSGTAPCVRRIPACCPYPASPPLHSDSLRQKSRAPANRSTPPPASSNPYSLPA